MKYWMLLCTLSLLVHFSMQGVKYENCSEQVTLLGEIIEDCLLIKCSGKGSSAKVEFQSCDTITCAGEKQVGFHVADIFKDYPECCNYPICEN